MSAARKQIREFEVGADEGPARIDRWLAGHMADVSRARIKHLILSGQVKRGAETIGDPSFRVKSGDVITIDVPDAAPASIAGEVMDLAIVYEDDAVIVIDKPAGLVVHPAAGHAAGTLVNALIAHCGSSLSGIGGVKRPGIVHRLDKDTSGLLVVAKTDAAHQNLSEQFKAHGADGRLRRVYRALVWGKPTRVAGTIDAPLSRSAGNRMKIAVTRGDDGRRAVTHFRVLEVFATANKNEIASLVELQLETGRTHQIRVHMAHIGHPVLGDEVYGASFKTRAGSLDKRAQEAVERLGRQALHAAVLQFEHPGTAEVLSFASEIPKDFQDVVDCLRGGGSLQKRIGEKATGRSSSPRRKKK